MIGSIARKIFGSANDRYVRKQYKTVEKMSREGKAGTGSTSTASF